MFEMDLGVIVSAGVVTLATMVDSELDAVELAMVKSAAVKSAPQESAVVELAVVELAVPVELVVVESVGVETMESTDMIKTKGCSWPAKDADLDELGMMLEREFVELG